MFTHSSYNFSVCLKNFLNIKNVLQINKIKKHNEKSDPVLLLTKNQGIKELEEAWRSPSPTLKFYR